MLTQLMMMLAGSTGDPGLVLWQDLHTGMSKKEVRALYPDKRVQLVPGCFAVVDFDYDKGRLTQVYLHESSADEQEACAVVVKRGLVEKYGEPGLVKPEVETTSCTYVSGRVGRALSSLCRPTATLYRHHYWISDGVQIRLRLTEGSNTEWIVEYRPAVSVTGDAADKL